MRRDPEARSEFDTESVRSETDSAEQHGQVPARRSSGQPDRVDEDGPGHTEHTRETAAESPGQAETHDVKRLMALRRQKSVLFYMSLLVIFAALGGAFGASILLANGHLDIGSYSSVLSAIIAAAMWPISRVWKRLENEDDKIMSRLQEDRRVEKALTISGRSDLAKKTREELLVKIAEKQIHPNESPPPPKHREPDAGD